jgi:hypothetical protein
MSWAPIGWQRSCTHQTSHLMAHHVELLVPSTQAREHNMEHDYRRRLTEKSIIWNWQIVCTTYSPCCSLGRQKCVCLQSRESKVTNLKHCNSRFVKDVGDKIRQFTSTRQLETGQKNQTCTAHLKQLNLIIMNITAIPIRVRKSWTTESSWRQTFSK